MNFTLIRQKASPKVYPIYYLRYLDQLIWMILKRKPVRWTPDGRLCHLVPVGNNFFAIECTTHFPAWWIVFNIRIKLFFGNVLNFIFRRKNLLEDKPKE